MALRRPVLFECDEYGELGVAGRALCRFRRRVCVGFGRPYDEEDGGASMTTSGDEERRRW